MATNSPPARQRPIAAPLCVTNSSVSGVDVAKFAVPTGRLKRRDACAHFSRTWKKFSLAKLEHSGPLPANDR